MKWRSIKWKRGERTDEISSYSNDFDDCACDRRFERLPTKQRHYRERFPGHLDEYHDEGKQLEKHHTQRGWHSNVDLLE
jgi:hypothetical protein